MTLFIKFQKKNSIYNNLQQQEITFHTDNNIIELQQPHTHV